MMQAKAKDMKVYSKLVNRKRNRVRGDTGLIIINDEKFQGDGQVLSGFFQYHQNSQTAPKVTLSEEDNL